MTETIELELSTSPLPHLRQVFGPGKAIIVCQHRKHAEQWIPTLAKLGRVTALMRVPEMAPHRRIKQIVYKIGVVY